MAREIGSDHAVATGRDAGGDLPPHEPVTELAVEQQGGAAPISPDMCVQALIGHRPIIDRTIWPVSSASLEQGALGVAVGPDRSLNWDGLLNGRDLGGLRTAHGPILPKRLVRSASVHTLSAAGWQELIDYGIRTVVDLRDDQEISETGIPTTLRQGDVALLREPLEPSEYVQAWSEREDRWKLSSPYYFDEFMTEHAIRVGRAITTIATAPPGGVLVHCHAGKDRAGITIAMILDLLDVHHETIAADHWISFDRPRSLESALGKADSPGKPAPDREIYAQLLGDLLSTHPATNCFVDSDQAREVRDQLPTGSASQPPDMPLGNAARPRSGTGQYAADPNWRGTRSKWTGSNASAGRRQVKSGRSVEGTRRH
jgi:hypothetical protein